MITAAELADADHLNCSMDKVYRLARSGEIPFLKVGSDYRFDWGAVKAALTPVRVDPWYNPRRRTRRVA